MYACLNVISFLCKVILVIIPDFACFSALPFDLRLFICGSFSFIFLISFRRSNPSWRIPKYPPLHSTKRAYVINNFVTFLSSPDVNTHTHSMVSFKL